MKIHVSYTEDAEEQEVMALLKPVLSRFKVKKSTHKPPFKHLYFISRKDKKIGPSA